MSQPTTSILLNSTAPAAPSGNQNCVPATDGATPLQSITLAPQKATSSLLGVVKPDGTTITVDGTGKLSAIAVVAPATVAPVLRVSNINSSNSATGLTVTFAGAVVGDFALVFAGGYSPTVPSGWTPVTIATGGTWFSMCAWKILTSGDISTGSVSSSFTAGLDCALAIYVAEGPTGGIREKESADNAGAGITITNTTSSAVLSSDVAIYFASTRAGSGGVIPVITPGSGSATTLQTAATSGSGDSQNILASQVMPGGVLAVANYFAAAGVGAFAAQIILQGITPTVLPPTGVVPGTYPNANITVDLDGRISAASSDLEGTTASLGGSSIAAGATVSGTVTLTGAVVGQKVAVSASDGSLPNPLIVLSAAVTAANTVTVQLAAIATVTPTAKTYNVTVIP
jgi:hypothetical protein